MLVSLELPGLTAPSYPRLTARRTLRTSNAVNQGFLQALDSAALSQAYPYRVRWRQRVTPQAKSLHQ
jgi:hypothetical protein